MSQKDKTVDKSITELMQELDNIVGWFNSGDVDIEQATAKFDEGVKLANIIKVKLTDTENKINQIKLRLKDSLDEQ